MSRGFHRMRSMPAWDPRNGRAGPWIQTYTGRRFYLADPRADDVDIRDIAWALGHETRYGGHLARFYSVAEHSLYASALAPRGLELEGLLHDGAEAYYKDLPRPLKELLPDYKALEARGNRVVRERFGLHAVQPPIIKTIDIALLADERREILGKTGPGAEWDWDPGPGYGITIAGWPPVEAAERFLQRYIDLTGGKE